MTDEVLIEIDDEVLKSRFKKTHNQIVDLLNKEYEDDRRHVFPIILSVLGAAISSVITPEKHEQAIERVKVYLKQNLTAIKNVRDQKKS